MEPTADEMGAYLAELSAEERGRLRILIQEGKLDDVLRLIDRFETEQMAKYTIVGEGVAWGSILRLK
jgi:hypothetical protein